MTAPATPQTDDLPNKTHPAYDRMQKAWQQCRDLTGGTDALRKARTLYLPKHPMEKEDDYNRRLAASTLYNAFARTVSAMVGLVFQRDPALGKDNPAILATHWENIDGQGTHGAVFARKVFRDGMITGHVGILVDAPAIENPSQLSKADESALGIRPYWVMYRAEDIRSWFHEDINGVKVLGQLTLRESYAARVGRFGVGAVTEYRVYIREGRGRIRYERWREEKSTSDAQIRVVMIAEGYLTKVQEIPFVWLSVGEFETTCETSPPLEDLADLNVAHYQVASDRRYLMHLGCVPVPVRLGYNAPPEGTTQPLGANILQDLPIGADFKWAEITGASFGPTKDELDRIEQQMGSLGMAFLAADTRAVETAKAKQIDSTAQNATLSNAARALGDALETALGFHAQYLSLEAGSATVNRDFEATMLDPAVIQVLSTLETSGQLSLDTLLKTLQAGNVFGEDFDPDAEIARILSGVGKIAGAASGGAVIPPVMPGAGAAGATA